MSLNSLLSPWDKPMIGFHQLGEHAAWVHYQHSTKFPQAHRGNCPVLVSEPLDNANSCTTTVRRVGFKCEQ
jgi:hypothetical protein